jgi:hypothetical protein
MPDHSTLDSVRCDLCRGLQHDVNVHRGVWQLDSAFIIFAHRELKPPRRPGGPQQFATFDDDGGRTRLVHLRFISTGELRTCS